MAYLTNGDFSDGLNGWTVTGEGPTSPTFDPGGQQVVFGNGDNDVLFGDSLSQQVALAAGQEYTLRFTIGELGAGNGVFGVAVDLTSGTDFQIITSAIVFDGQSNEVVCTFTSDFDNPTLFIHGDFGFGGVNSVLIFDNARLTCFVSGTRIATPGGSARVESLVPGDLVRTRDDGAMPVRWCGCRSVSAAERQARPDWQPVLIAAGALGPGRPRRDLWVSQGHKILLRGAPVELLTGESELLVPAGELAGRLPGIAVVDPGACEVAYHHLMFDGHAILWSEGLETESFHPCGAAMDAWGRQTKAELLALFPELGVPGAPRPRLSRPVMRRHEIGPVTAAMQRPRGARVQAANGGAAGVC